jgi:hypothetical protein
MFDPDESILAGNPIGLLFVEQVFAQLEPRDVEPRDE